MYFLPSLSHSRHWIPELRLLRPLRVDPPLCRVPLPVPVPPRRQPLLRLCRLLPQREGERHCQRGRGEVAKVKVDRGRGRRRGEGGGQVGDVAEEEEVIGGVGVGEERGAGASAQDDVGEEGRGS